MVATYNHRQKNGYRASANTTRTMPFAHEGLFRCACALGSAEFRQHQVDYAAADMA
jgi:hypothetical protein